MKPITEQKIRTSFAFIQTKKATFAGNCENYDDKTHNNRREIYHADGAYFCSSGTYAYVFQAISQ